MATRCGICIAGKISHDFTVALKTLPAEDYQFSEKRMAVFIYCLSMKLPNAAIIVGTKGTIQVNHQEPFLDVVPHIFNCEWKGDPVPLPEPCLPLNFHNGTGMRYEAEVVRQCLLKGLKESPVMSYSDSLLLIELEDEIHRQVGVVYSQDCQ